MAGNMSRNKGQRGEREGAALLMLWSNEVLAHLREAYVKEDSLDCYEDIVFNRNLAQTREGGYDLVGLDWLAVEVKRHETLNVTGWWKQTVEQAKPDQIPFLMYRQNRTEWKFRVRINARPYQFEHVIAKPIDVVSLDVDMNITNAAKWFKSELFNRYA